MRFDNNVYAFINEKALFEKCSGIVLAVSGGPDSMAMLYFFIKNKSLFRFPFIVAHVNHKLREQSDDEMEFVKGYCKQNNVVCETLIVDIKKYCPKGVSVEAFARDIRYSFFKGLCNKFKYSHIATAHNADDNAETLLLNLLRGSGLNGASGISCLREDLVARPLLKIEKAEILNYCKQNNIPFVIDKTNFENIYMRNIIRNKIIPELKDINPSVLETFGRFMESAETDEEYLQSQADIIIEKIDFKDGIKIEPLKNLHISLLSRIIRKIFFKISTEKVLTFKQTNDIIFLIRNGKTSDQIQLSDGWFAEICYDMLIFKKDRQKKSEITDFKPEIGINYINDIGYIKFTKTCYNKDTDTNLFMQDNIIELSVFSNCVIRSRKSGDTIALPKKPGSKTLKKLFIDNKIPRELRDSIPVLATNDKIVWVYGFGTDKEFLPDTENTDKKTFINIETHLNI